MPGFLIITGLEWEFLDIPTSYTFSFDLKDQTKKKSANFFNKFRVLSKAPLLNITLESSFNPEIYYGEIRPFKLNLTNNGDVPISNIIMRPLVPIHFGFQEMMVNATI